MATVRAEIDTFRFHIWERVLLTTGDEGNEGIYSCRISDIKNNRLIISRPVFERGKSLLADNRIVSAYCTRADAVYSFSARLRETRPKSPDTMYLLDMGKIRRVQRRRFVRLEKSISLKYMVLPRPIQEPIDLSSSSIESGTLNMSAGGLLIKNNSELAVEDTLLVIFESCSLKKLPSHILAVCRHTSLNDNKQKVSGVEFILREDLPRYLKDTELKMVPPAATQFDDSMQNGLVSEVFSEQLVMRQKGQL